MTVRSAVGKTEWDFYQGPWIELGSAISCRGAIDIVHRLMLLLLLLLLLFSAATFGSYYVDYVTHAARVDA